MELMCRPGREADATGRDVGTVVVGVTGLDQAGQDFVFELVFGHAASPGAANRIRFSATLM